MNVSLSKCIETHGFMALKFLGLLLHNDYASVNGVGPSTAVKVLEILCNGSVRDLLPNIGSSIRKAAISILDLRAHKKQSVEAATIGRQNAIEHIQLQLENAYVMFSYQMVSDVGANGPYLTYLSENPPSDESIEQELGPSWNISRLRTFVGFDLFENSDYLSKFLTGFCDLRLRTPISHVEEQMSDPVVPTTLNGSTEPVDLLIGGTSDEVASDEYIKKLPLNGLIALAKRWRIPGYSVPKPALLKLILINAKYLRLGGLNQLSTVMTDDEMNRVNKLIFSCYETMKMSGWNSMSVIDSERKGNKIVMDPNVIADFSLRVTSSSRTERIAASRPASHCHVRWDYASKHYSSELCIYIQTLFVYVHIQRSSSSDPRTVFYKFAAKAQENNLSGPIEIICCQLAMCIPKEGVINQDGTTVSCSSVAKNYNVCRGGAHGQCCHCLTGLQFLKEGGINQSTTQFVEYWRERNGRTSVGSFPKTNLLPWCFLERAMAGTFMLTPTRLTEPKY